MLKAGFNRWPLAGVASPASLLAHKACGSNEIYHLKGHSFVYIISFILYSNNIFLSLSSFVVYNIKKHV